MCKGVNEMLNVHYYHHRVETNAHVDNISSLSLNTDLGMNR